MPGVPGVLVEGRNETPLGSQVSLGELAFMRWAGCQEAFIGGWSEVHYRVCEKGVNASESHYPHTPAHTPAGTGLHTGPELQGMG